MYYIRTNKSVEGIVMFWYLYHISGAKIFWHLLFVENDQKSCPHIILVRSPIL